MKFGILLFMLMVMPTAKTEAQVDTIVVHADTICNNFMPVRIHYAVTSKYGGGYEYDDSIRVCRMIIDVYNKDYYLIVFDKDSVKRMEGFFHDEYANGHSINYDYKGRKTSEGDYEMIRKRRYTYYRKTGMWKYYNANGDLIRQEKNR